MIYSVDREESKKLAENLGLKITFDVEKPGIFESSTGRYIEVEEFIDEVFQSIDVKHVKKVEGQPFDLKTTTLVEGIKNIKLNSIKHLDYCA